VLKAVCSLVMLSLEFFLFEVTEIFREKALCMVRERAQDDKSR
jgi:hypothetical protein